MTEKLPSTSWVIFSTVLLVNKLCPVQFVKCPTKSKIRKDICPLNKKKILPALQPSQGIKPGTKRSKNYYARASHKSNCAKLAPPKTLLHFIITHFLFFFFFFDRLLPRRVLATWDNDGLLLMTLAQHWSKRLLSSSGQKTLFASFEENKVLYLGKCYKVSIEKWPLAIKIWEMAFVH